MTADPRARILLVSMYPLDRGLWGATARIRHLRDALARRVDLDVIGGTRGARARGLMRYVLSGRLRGLDGIYVENSTSLPGPIDLAFLAVARLWRRRILTYIRDAQQLYPEYYAADSLKRRVSRAAFLPLTRSLMRLSTVVGYPSRGLAAAVGARADHAELLPPGSPEPVAGPPQPAARAFLYVGNLRLPAHGAEILVSGMQRVRDAGHDVHLICVVRPGEERRGSMPSWAQLVRAEGNGILDLLPNVIATITPYRKTPYNDLAVPVKLMEYLAYGRPTIVTDLTESAAIVRSAGCGVVVQDTAEGIADGVLQVLNADSEKRAAWGRAASAAAVAHSWDIRATRILELLGVAA